MQFEGNLWVAIAVLFLGELVLTAIALAASTRLGQVLTLVTTVGFFLLGLLSDWLIARRIARLEEISAAAVAQGGRRGRRSTLAVTVAGLLKSAYADRSELPGLLAGGRDHPGCLDPAGIPGLDHSLRLDAGPRGPCRRDRVVPASRGGMIPAGSPPDQSSHASASSSRVRLVMRKPTMTG